MPLASSVPPLYNMPMNAPIQLAFDFTKNFRYCKDCKTSYQSVLTEAFTRCGVCDENRRKEYLANLLRQVT